MAADLENDCISVDNGTILMILVSKYRFTGSRNTIEYNSVMLDGKKYLFSTWLETLEVNICRR